MVALVTIAAFLPTLGNGFVSWDDDKNLLSNPHFRGLGWNELRWMWSTFHLGHYIPLSWMSLGADYVLWGMNPAGYHATSLLLHVANALLLYCIARRFFAMTTPATGTAIAAAVAALLFAVHPLRVESVAWITERRDVLSGAFYLSAIYAWLRFSASDRHARRWYVATLAAAACALLSKATAVTLPVVLAIISVYPMRRTAWRDGWWSSARRSLYRELAPVVVMAAATAALAFVALQREAQLTVGGKVAVSAYSLVFYLRQTIAPAGLSPLYAMPTIVDPFAARFVLSYVVVVALSFAAWAVRHRAPAATATWIAFVLVLLPLLGVHQNGPQIAADRYTYNASLAFALCAGGALLAIQTRHAARTGSDRVALDGAGFRSVILAGIVIATLGGLTWKQSLVWHDSASLWTRALVVEPDSPIAHNNLANVLMLGDQLDGAAEHYARALALSPDYVEAEDNMGVVLARRGRFDEAVSHHQRALALDPGYANAHNNWGVALAKQSMDSAAIVHFREALRLSPDYADAHVNWGNALVRLGRPAEAVEQYGEALALRPDNADAESNWGVALARQERYAEAIEHFLRALAIDRDHREAREYLARTERLLRTPRP